MNRPSLRLTAIAAAVVSVLSLSAAAQTDAAFAAALGNYPSGLATMAKLKTQQQTPASEDQLNPEDIRLFDLLMARLNATDGIPASAIDPAADPDPSLPQNKPEEIKRRFAEAERERAGAFDQQFGDGTFAALVGSQKGCLSTNGCDLLAIAGLIEAAYKLVDLGKGPQEGLDARRKLILDGMKPYLNRLAPSGAPNTDEAAKRSQVLVPIAEKVFTKSELERFKA